MPRAARSDSAEHGASVDGSIQDGSLPSDPLALLAQWLPGDDDPARPVATLATVDDDGLPDARAVLLSSYRDGVFTFHTDRRSRKVEQLRSRPAAAIVLAWPERVRQLVVRGPVSESPLDEQRRAYARRSRYLQLLAWLNSDDLAQQDREAREAEWDRFDREHDELSPPDAWTGFALRPLEVLLWEGSATGPSRRAHYRRQDGAWRLDVRAG